jgi:hypothetical protein
MSDDDVTPIDRPLRHSDSDRPLMRSDLNDMRQGMHDISQKTIAMYNEFRGVRGQLRTYVAVCIASAFLSIVSAAISAIAAAAK